MLTILGIVMFVFWLFDSASHRPAGSWIHLLSTIACISFVAEFVRSRVVAAWENRGRQGSKALAGVDEAARPLPSSSRSSVSAS
jgi:hypothetical protein